MANLFDYHFGARWPEITVRKTPATFGGAVCLISSPRVPFN